MRLPRLIVAVVIALTGCPEERAPSYVRVEGRVPVNSDLPTRGPVLVAFWATWCPPCREETPALVDLAVDPPAGLSVVVVSEDVDLPTVERFLNGPPDPRLNLRLDPGEALVRDFGVERLPRSFLIVDGRLVARFDGPQPWDARSMRRLLARLIAEAAADRAGL